MKISRPSVIVAVLLACAACSSRPVLPSVDATEERPINVNNAPVIKPAGKN